MLPYEINGTRLELINGQNAEITVPAGSVIRFDVRSGGCWYGHGFNHRQPYPLNAEAVINDRFAVNNIQSPVWMCEQGFVLYAANNGALRVNMSGETLEISNAYQYDTTIKVFSGHNLPEAHRKYLDHISKRECRADATRRTRNDCRFTCQSHTHIRSFFKNN